MSDNLPNDERFAELMRKSKLTMPFSDFEDKVMHKIEEGLKAKQSIVKEINVTIFFFILGTGFGTAVSLFLPQVLHDFLPISSQKIVLIFQAAFVVIFLLQFEGLVKLLRKHWRI